MTRTQSVYLCIRTVVRINLCACVCVCVCVCVFVCAYMRDDDEWTRASSLYFKRSVGMSFVVALKGTRGLQQG